MIGALIGAFTGYGLGRKYLSGYQEKQIHAAYLDDDPARAQLTVNQCFWRGKTFYRLFVIDGGDWACVASSGEHAEILARIQQWEAYLRNGGTINAWRVRNAVRDTEINDMNADYERARAAFSAWATRKGT